MDTEKIGMDNFRWYITMAMWQWYMGVLQMGLLTTDEESAAIQQAAIDVVQKLIDKIQATMPNTPPPEGLQ